VAKGGNVIYPTIESVLGLVRSQVLDDMAGATDTVGEGQIYVDDTTVSVTLSNFFNAELEELCSELRATNGPMLVRDNYLLEGLTPINSAQGLAAPNPAVQCCVNAAGYFDGTTVHPDLTLPVDMLYPDQVWERLNGSNGRFVPMAQAVRGLSSCNQGARFGEFEWRGDGIYLHGATTVRDLRIRYFGSLVNLYTPGVDLATAYIPIKGCKQALADKIVVRIARRIAPERLMDAQGSAAKSLFNLRNELVKQKQGIEYEPNAFGDEAGPFLGL
jgi:hypothetical protein